LTRKDPLRLLEAAYSLDAPEPAWLQGVAQALLPYDLGHGMAIYVAELGPKLGHRSVVQANLAFDMALAVPHYMSEIPGPLWRRVHEPSPAMSNVLKGRAATRQLGLAYPDVARIAPRGQMTTCWGAAGGDRGVDTVSVCLICAPGAPLPAVSRHALDALAAHLGACQRLRRSLQGATPGPDAPRTEAVLSPDGRVLDARGPAAIRSLSAVVEAVRRTERARLRRTGPEERLALWTALFEGRWSIVETVERDGKRMLLACRNEPETAALRNLSSLERSVVEFVALGHPYKYVAYELGISLSGVAAHLQHALRKLGLPSRAALIRVLGRAIGGSGVTAADGQMTMAAGPARRHRLFDRP
jgi:DNA-binding CsgD family transcriptional regulator